MKKVWGNWHSLCYRKKIKEENPLKERGWRNGRRAGLRIQWVTPVRVQISLLAL